MDNKIMIVLIVVILVICIMAILKLTLWKKHDDFDINYKQYGGEKSRYITKRSLMEAVSKKDIEEVKYLLKNHVGKGKEIDIDYHPQWGRTALILAVKNRDKDIVKLLLDHGADSDEYDESNKKSALIYATEYGDKDIVKLLLDHNAYIYHSDNNFKEALDYAAELGYSEIVELILNKISKDRPHEYSFYTKKVMKIAARDGQYDVVKLLLENGVDPTSEDSHLALKFAIRNGYDDIVKLIKTYDTSDVDYMMTHFNVDNDADNHEDNPYDYYDDTYVWGR